MFKINCLNNISTRGLDLLDSSYSVVDDLQEANGILVRSAALHDVEFPENLLAIARAGAGVNNIPLQRCAEEGIVVFNTPGANANAVKELVLAALLMGSRDILGGVAWCEENKENENVAKAAEKAKKQFAGNEILGKTLGVVGLGAIGILVANAANDLGMKVIGFDPFLSVAAAQKINPAVTCVANVDELYEKADFVTIHVPALPATKGMINAEVIGKMKDGVKVLNFSRDTLVNTEDMVKALQDEKVALYITDFAVPEILAAPNTIVIPHLGASTAEAEENCACMAVTELRNYLEQGNIKNSVNFPACDMGLIPENTYRIALLHRNQPNMIARFTKLMADLGVNIENLTNKNKGDFAYTLIDVDNTLTKETIEELKAIEGVSRVRVVNE